MGDRVVVMNQGSVRQIGTPAEVYDDPADTFVATFLGSPPMNLARARRGHRRASGRSTSSRSGSRRAAVPADPRGDGGPYVPLRFRVSHEEYLGAERILYGTLDGGPFDGKKAISRMSVDARAPLRDRHRPRTSRSPSGDLKFFDRETETDAPRRRPAMPVT